MPITIPSGLITTYNDGIDAILTFNSIPCTLVFPPKLEACANCEQDLIGKKSANRYKAGGPIPFPNSTICPLCQGAGFKEVENTETINMAVYWTPKEWLDVGIKIDVPDGVIQTKCYLTDLPSIKRCSELKVAGNLAPYMTYRFVRRGEPVPHGFKSDRYIITFWDRI